VAPRRVGQRQVLFQRLDDRLGNEHVQRAVHGLPA
jgi:hypothetical protein